MKDKKEEKIILEGVKQKFGEAREKCPGMSDYLYAITDYISLIANDSLDPYGLSTYLVLIMDDLQKGRNGFKPDEALPEYFRKHKNLITTQIGYVPQVVDAIANEKFAKEFRKICKEQLGIDPPKKINTKEDSQYPEYVQVAVDWWANAIQEPTFDNGNDMNKSQGMISTMIYASNRKQLSEEDIKIFKDVLAKEILEEMKKHNTCQIDVDYHPCLILLVAGEEIGLTNMTDYPWKTFMYINEYEVKVRSGYDADIKTIWYLSMDKEQGIHK